MGREFFVPAQTLIGVKLLTQRDYFSFYINFELVALQKRCNAPPAIATRHTPYPYSPPLWTPPFG